MTSPRIGIGYDAHRFGGSGPVVLAGVSIVSPFGVLGTSDADVAAHAVADALLGAACLGDLGKFFPSDDAQWHGANSMELLARCVQKVRDAGFEPGNVDLTVVVEKLRVAPHRESMRSNLAKAIQLPVSAVSVKATTTDGLGWIGAGEGLAVQAVVAIHRH